MVTRTTSSQRINNRYDLLETIGKGGMGVVYKALDRLTGAYVALKQVTVPKDTLEIVTRASADADHDVLLAHEFSTLASLRHPNIISVLDYGFDRDNAPFYTMTLLQDAMSIADYTADLTIPEITNYLIDILQALRYLHQRGILHRDLKPANIMVVHATPKVLDFGLALDATYQQNHEHAVGTLAYIAPEMFRGQPATIQSDLYAFAVLAHELLTGQHPFPSDSQSDLIQKVLFEPPTVSTEKLDDALGAVLMRALSKSPEDRYTNAVDFMRALSKATDIKLSAESIEIRESMLVASTFVGRQEEVDTLKTAFQETRKGTGSAWLIGGESGVGKTRLMNELRTYALVNGALAIRGQAITESTVPYKIWRDILPHLVLMNELTDDEAATLATLIPNIERLLGRPVPTAVKDPAILQQRIPILIAKLLTEASQQSPILLLLEDLQWATQDLDILETILPRLVNYPIMIVGNYRNDEAPHLADRLYHMQHMTLQRLSDADIRKLSVAMLGNVGKQRTVVDLIQRESDGNAFFIVEVVRALAQQAGQLADIGRVTLPAQVFSGGIRQIIQRRLDALPEWALEPTRIAAIVGRELDLEIIKHILPTVDVFAWVEICNETAVISISENTWHFAHDKIREHIVASITEDDARAYHLRIAQALEAVHADELLEHAARLTEHYAAGEDEAKEAHYAGLAATQLKHLYPNQALTYIERALELKAYATADNPAAEEARLTLLHGHILVRAAQYKDALGILASARDKYLALDDELGVARTDCSIGECHMRTIQLHAAVESLEQSIEVLTRYEDWTYVGEAYMNLGAAYNQLGNMPKTRVCFEKCYEILQTHGDAISLAKALNNLGNITDIMGDQDEAEKLHFKALAIRRDIGDIRGIATSLVNLSFISLVRGNHEQRIEYLTEALRNARLLGDAYIEANVLDMLGKTYLKTNDRATALSYFQEAHSIAQKTESPQIKNTVLFDLARFYKISDKHEALRYFLKIADLTATIDHVWSKVGFLHEVVDILLDLGITDTRLVTWFTLTEAHKEGYDSAAELEKVQKRLQDLYGMQIYTMATTAAQTLSLKQAVADLATFTTEYLQTSDSTG